VKPVRPAEKRIRILLEDLETRARRGPGLFPVCVAEDFFRLAALHLGLPPGPLETLADLDAGALEDLAAALETLVREPAEAPVWVNRILLKNGAHALIGIPRNACRENARKPAEQLASLLRGGDGESQAVDAAA